MARKRVKVSRGMLFTGSILAGLVFLFLVPKSVAGHMQLTYARLFRWPLATGRSLALTARTAEPAAENVSPRDFQELLTANRRLQNDKANLQAQLADAHSRIEDLAKLRLKSAWETMQFAPADVIAMSGPAQNELIISRGDANMVALGQYVMSLADHSIVGTISDVSARSAKVRLITDPDSRIAVSIGELNVRGWMEGRGNGTAGVPLIPTTHKIRRGDKICVQKQPGFLDSPIIAAQVTECRPDPDNPLVWDITARPVCNAADLKEVVVVISVARPQ